MFVYNNILHNILKMNCIQKFKKMTQETFKKVLTYVIFDRSEKNETLYTKILTWENDA